MPTVDGSTHRENEDDMQRSVLYKTDLISGFRLGSNREDHRQGLMVLSRRLGGLFTDTLLSD